jgi:methyl-accepting chemotaxis protein
VKGGAGWSRRRVDATDQRWLQRRGQAVTVISNSLREQKSTSSAIAKRVEHIAHMTEETSMVVSQVATNAEQLKAMADELKQAVSGFRV